VSDADPQSESRAQALWEAVGGDAGDLKGNGSAETVEVTYELLDNIFGRTNDLEDRIDELERSPDGVSEHAPPIEYYANIPPEERAELLSTSEQIAVELHTNWEDIAWKLGDATHRRIGVDSKTKANAKYNPSRLKQRLKGLLNRDFESIEIYRGLKRLAKLSGGEETTDSANRVHVTGGLYEYHHRSTIDGRDTKHVLYRSNE
jgi:hypothetical protein